MMRRLFNKVFSGGREDFRLFKSIYKTPRMFRKG